MRLLSTILFSILFIGSAYSQETIEVNVEPKEMSQGIQTAFTVLVPEADMELAEKQWKKFLNERPLSEILAKGGARTFENAYNSITNIFSKDKKSSSRTTLKVQKENNELIAVNVVHNEVSQDPFDIYAKLNLKENGVEVVNFFKYTDSTFIKQNESNEDLVTSLTLYTRMFGIEAYKAVYDQYISDEKKILRKEKSTLRGLENKNKNMHKNIAKLEGNIDDYRSDIEFKTEDLVNIKKKISETKNKMYKIDKKSLQYESMKEVKKGYEGDYKKSRNQIKKNKKKIKSSQNKIVKQNSKIQENEDEQEAQQAVIDNQEAVIDALIEKQDNIK